MILAQSSLLIEGKITQVLEYDFGHPFLAMHGDFNEDVLLARVLVAFGAELCGVS